MIITMVSSATIWLAVTVTMAPSPPSTRFIMSMSPSNMRTRVSSSTSISNSTVAMFGEI